MSFTDTHTNSQPLPEAPEMLDKAAWHVSLGTHVEQANLDGSPLSVAFIDVNFFKEINDSLGHVRGDQVISDVQRVISSALRTGDSQATETPEQRNIAAVAADTIAVGANSVAPVETGHIGGDEWAVAARTDAVGMTAMVGRIRSVFDSYMAQPENEDLRGIGIGGISLAIGAATLEANMDASALLSKADDAMYEDKLNQLPELTDKQRRGVRAARFILNDLGLRLRDVAKLEQLVDRHDSSL